MSIVIDPSSTAQVQADADDQKTVIHAAGGTVYYADDPAVSASSNDGSLVVGDDLTVRQTTYFFSTDGARLEVSDVQAEADIAGAVEVVSEEYAADGSYQPVAADLNLAAAAGTSASGDTSFLAGVMGNIIGSALSKTHNFVAGLIGAYSVDTSNASDLPSGGVLGILMDGTQGADGAVVAVLDGSDPSTATNATAAFKAMANTNIADTSVEYGVDLYDVGRDSTVYSGGGLPFKITKAILRSPSQVVWMEGAGAPVDGTTGDNFAGKGSLYTDTTNAKLYIQTGAITSPTWVVVGTQS